MQSWAGLPSRQSTWLFAVKSHLSYVRQTLLYICNPLHSVQFSCFLASAVFFQNYYFSVDPDLGLNWLHLLSAVAELITRPKNICRWRLRPNFKGQFVRVLCYRICEQRMPRWAYTFAEYNHSLCCLNWKKWSNVDEGSGPTLFLLRQWFCCCWFIL